MPSPRKRYRNGRKSDAGKITEGWILVVSGAGALLWLLANGWDTVFDRPKNLVALILAPIGIALGFWKLSGAEDDDE